MRLNPEHTKRAHIVMLTVFLSVVLAIAFAVSLMNRPPRELPALGITYSSKYAAQLGLDPVGAYETLLKDLGVTRVRLPAYWSDIEREQDVYDWSRMDALMELSEQYGAEVTFAVGMKVPRWPECYIPDWAEARELPRLKDEVVEFVALATERYRSSPAIIRWQVENEPFFPFGICPDADPGLLSREIAAVRERDDRPIQLTVSGELEPWLDVAAPADILGVSMYRLTWNDFFGFFYYPISPSYYRAKALAARPLADKIIITELQAEPWFPEPIDARPPGEWAEAFDVELLDRNIRFASETGLDEAYLWGAEWWLFLRENGHDALFERARELFRRP